MHEDLEFGVGHLAVDVGNLVDRQFAGQHHSAEALTGQPAHLAGGAVVGLRRGMDGQADVLSHAHHSHVLHQHGIGTARMQLLQQTSGVSQFVIEYNGIDRHVDPCPVAMSIVAEASDVVHAVACRSPCAKPPCTDIDGIGPVVDGRYAALQVAGRGKQFERSHPIWLMS